MLSSLRTMSLSYLLWSHAWHKADGHSVHIHQAPLQLRHQFSPQSIVPSSACSSFKALESWWHQGSHVNKHKFTSNESGDQDIFSTVCWQWLFIIMTLGHCKVPTCPWVIRGQLNCSLSEHFVYQLCTNLVLSTRRWIRMGKIGFAS